MKRFLKWAAIGLGALLVVLALAVFVFPSALANASRGFIESEFAKRFHGTVALGELELAWNGPQTIRSVEVFDPEGKKVLATTIVAPSLRQLLDRKQLGKARIELEADLVADDAGVTNLERALEPRDDAKRAPDASDGSSEPTDWRKTLAELDVEVELVSKRITWSDARTRAAGRPIALANLAATAKLAHGEKVDLAFAAELVDDAPRPLKLDATVLHPFAAPGAAEPPTLALTADLRELPTGLIDGLAGLGGTLTRVLGPQVSVTATGNGTATAGALEFALDAPRARIVGNVTLADGVLRGVGDQALSAEVEVDQGVLDAFVSPSLPPGLALERAAGPRVALKVEGLTVELAKLLDALARGEDVVALALATSRGGVRAELGDWRVRDAARGLDVGVRALTAQASLDSASANGDAQADSAPASASMSFVLVGSSEPVELQLGIVDAREALGVANGGGLQGASWTLDARGIPPALLASFGAPATEGLGLKGKGSVALAPRATPGPFTAQDLERIDASGELALSAGRVALSPDLALGNTRVDATFRAHGSIELEARGRAALDSTSESSFTLSASMSDGVAKLASGAIPNVEVSLKATDLPLALADRFTGDAYQLAKRVGASANVELDAQGDLDAATAKLKFTSAHATLAADLAVADRKVSLGPEPVKFEADVDVATVAELLGPYMPPGASLEPVDGRQRVKVQVEHLGVPLDAWMPSAANSTLDLGAALDASMVGLTIRLGNWRWRDAKLEAAQQTVSLDAFVSVDLREPGARPRGALTLGGNFEHTTAVGDHSVTCSLSFDDVRECLTFMERRQLGRAGVLLDAKRVPTGWLEAYTGSLDGKVGPHVDMSARLDVAWPLGERIQVDGLVRLDSKFRAELKASLADPFAAMEKGLVPEAELALDVSDPALALAFVPAEYRELASEALGQKFGLKVANRASAGATQSFSVALDAPGAKLDVAGVLDGRTFRATGADRIVASLPLHSKTLAPLLATYLPAGVSVELVTDGEAVAFTASELELALDPWLPAPGAEPEALSVALDRTKVKVELSLPSVRVRAPAVTPNGAPVDVTLRSLALTGVELAPGKLVGAKVTGELEATPPGSLALSISGVHPFGLLDDRGGALKPKLVVDGEVKQIPTALVDALAAQDGLIVDVLGAGADVKLHGTWPPDGADALSAELHSPSADLKVQASAAGGVLTSTGEQGLDASMIVTPLFGQRVVGSLVPLIADIRQVEGSKRALLSGRKFSLPLSGDLRQLNGEITLDPGALEYRFLPGILELFSDSAAKGMSSAKLEPVNVQITKGVARYERLALPIGGKTYVFKGSFDLVERAYKLEVELPLSALGKSVTKSLEGAADFLDPETKIPIEIRGNSAKPKLRIADGFLTKVLEDAAGRALEKKLKDLLDGDKDKKKKKKPQ
ncbi:MAG: hypothetical protein HZA52_01595 [Planctomycetes bacterium]|nr:hypothetical protein [Planctomycetota bacterium]